MHFFRYDSPLSQLLIKFCNIIFLTLLWMLFCIPIFTIGASTSAFYYTIEKNIKNDRGYVHHDFWASFKDCFKQSTVVTLVFLLVEFIFFYDYSIMQQAAENGMAFGNIYVLFEILMVLLLVYAIWIFVSIARFHNTLRNIRKNALILMIRHFGTTLIMLALVGFAALSIYIIPLSAVIMPAVVAWLISFPVEKVFNKYVDMSKPEEKPEDEELKNVERVFSDNPKQDE